ncbi:DNA invertase Pin-like site-specific DNA recombinase [Bacillus pakistanensis]|uniref:DNA invertase Pin-like site-specific DNA recombinase n=1 Tax=Rossellomorea pakistanensis TaxID=992288 RepID=A0ABS2N828_9BACI|nr:recombinase family protein [Bacillus pakistanensis]MBM7583751.1 DNA invertase Pin-like site-specific DNA recombinase [Bacillus pakistanensis]
MKVRYARVSTRIQNLDLQLDAFKEHGCEEIFTDKICWAKDKRQGLENALRFVKTGNTLVGWF